MFVFCGKNFNKRDWQWLGMKKHHCRGKDINIGCNRQDLCRNQNLYGFFRYDLHITFLKNYVFVLLTLISLTMSVTSGAFM